MHLKLIKPRKKKRSIKCRIVGHKLRHLIPLSLRGKRWCGGMAPQEPGKVLSSFFCLAALLRPNARMVTVLAKGIRIRPLCVKLDLCFESLQDVKVLVDRDGCELNNRVAFWVRSPSLKVKEYKSCGLRLR